MEQKFIITWSQKEIQELLDSGWRVVSVTAIHEGGKVAVVLERSKNKDMSEKLLKSKLVQPKHDSPFGN